MILQTDLFVEKIMQICITKITINCEFNKNFTNDHLLNCENTLNSKNKGLRNRFCIQCILFSYVSSPSFELTCSQPPLNSIGTWIVFFMVYNSFCFQKLTQHCMGLPTYCLADTIRAKNVSSVDCKKEDHFRLIL